jgi:hypothetical protein
MSWKYWAYKAGQCIGGGGTLFIAIWLLTHPWYEPHASIRWLEIIFSIIATVVLGADALDLNPQED